MGDAVLVIWMLTGRRTSFFVYERMKVLLDIA